MTKCPQRRFEPFVRWQIIPRGVLSHLSGDKSSAETFWAICQMTNRSQRRFGTRGPSTLRKITIWEHLHSGVFAWKGIFMDCHADARNDGWSPFWLRLVSSLNFTNSLNSSDSSPIRGAKSARILFGRLAGGKIIDCHADARNGGWKSPLASPCPLLEFHKLPQSFGQPPIRGAKSARILFGRLAGGKIIDCHADARNDSLGTWVYKSFFTKIVSGGNLSKVFSRARG